jgi:polyhydroxybutyrate depolymerase
MRLIRRLRRRRPDRRGLGLVLITGLLVVVLIQAARAETREVTLSDGRSYRIDLPASPDDAPMILALHGGGGNPDQTARNSGLTAPALAKGYAVIFPEGTGRRLLTWNAGHCCAQAARRDVDDVAYLDTVIADAAQRFGLNPARVYLTGMSNGSMMAERYAAERPGAVRAVAGVAGTMDLAIRIRGVVPLLHIHGTADASVPYGGGVGEGVTRTDFDSVPDLIAAWRRANRADRDGGSRIVDPVEDGRSASVQDWTDAKGRVMVRLITIEGGEHEWPGGNRSQKTGPRDISANDEVLRFFALHP